MTGEGLTNDDQKLLERALMASAEKLYDINEETDGDRAIFAVLHGVAIGQLSPINSVERIKAIFAPILAEKDLHNATGERITRRDLNNAHRKGAEEGRLAAHLIDGVNSPLNACCYRDGCRALEARALAAEAALAGERERCALIAERFMAAGKVVDGQLYAGPNTPRAIAAAIRAEGSV